MFADETHWALIVLVLVLLALALLLLPVAAFPTRHPATLKLQEIDKDTIECASYYRSCSKDSDCDVCVAEGDADVSFRCESVGPAGDRYCVPTNINTKGCNAKLGGVPTLQTEQDTMHYVCLPTLPAVSANDGARRVNPGVCLGTVQTDNLPGKCDCCPNVDGSTCDKVLMYHKTTAIPLCVARERARWYTGIYNFAEPPTDAAQTNTICAIEDLSGPAPNPICVSDARTYARQNGIRLEDVPNHKLWYSEEVVPGTARAVGCVPRAMQEAPGSFVLSKTKQNFAKAPPNAYKYNFLEKAESQLNPFASQNKNPAVGMDGPEYQTPQFEPLVFRYAQKLCYDSMGLGDASAPRVPFALEGFRDIWQNRSLTTAGGQVYFNNHSPSQTQTFGTRASCAEYKTREECNFNFAPDSKRKVVAVSTISDRELPSDAFGLEPSRMEICKWTLESAGSTQGSCVALRNINQRLLSDKQSGRVPVTSFMDTLPQVSAKFSKTSWDTIYKQTEVGGWFNKLPDDTNIGQWQGTQADGTAMVSYIGGFIRPPSYQKDEVFGLALPNFTAPTQFAGNQLYGQALVDDDFGLLGYCFGPDRAPICSNKANGFDATTNQKLTNKYGSKKRTQNTLQYNSMMFKTSYVECPGPLCHSV